MPITPLDWIGSILLSYFPTTLGIAFVAQRTRNTGPGVIAHFVSNLGLPFLMLSRLLPGPG